MGSTKALTLIVQISPAARRHILLDRHRTVRRDGQMIDPDALVTELDPG